MLKYSKVFMLVVAAAKVNLADNNAGDEMAVAATSLCEEAAYLAGLRQHLKQKKQAKRRETETNKKLADKWRLEAATTDDKRKRCLYLALVHRTDQQAAADTVRIQREADDIDAALEIVDQQLGAITTTLRFAQIKFDDGGAKQGGADTTHRTFRLDASVGGTALCSPPTEISKIANKNKEPSFEKLHTIKTTKLEELTKIIKGTKTTISGLTSCTAYTSYDQAYTATMNGCSYNSGGTLTGQLERADKTYHGTDKQLFQGNTRTGECTVKQLTPPDAKDREKDLSHLLCKAPQATDSTTKPFSELSGSQLQAEPAVLLSIRNCDEKFSTSQTKDGLSENTELKEYVKSAFGEDSVKFRTAFVDALKSLKPPVRTEQKIYATKGVEELAGTVDAAAAAAHAEGERIKKEIEAEKKAAPTKKFIPKRRRIARKKQKKINATAKLAVNSKMENAKLK
uniref:Variant surface glycoprotein 1125.4803 n=1 Tax=Trypanosoma brucei TaxID=5691 RepID=A0A1J0RB66_9TRYP|nr:variant surface glycoprotein 1125.4803 [Trypanosoma brucei]